MGAGADGLVTVQVRAIVEQAQAALAAVAGSASEATTTIVEGMESANVAATIASNGIVINLNNVSQQAHRTAAETGLSLRGIETEFAELAEAVELSSLRSISAFGAFGLFSKALGVGVIGVMGAALLNKFKDTEVELYHLSEATGVSISRIVQMQAAMAESGTSSERLGVMLTRLSRAIVSAAEGGQQATASFGRLGIDVADWGGKIPPVLDVFKQLTAYIHDSSDATKVLGSASQVLGRNIVGMLGFMKQGPEVIEGLMSHYVGLGDSQQKAATGAMELTALEAMLSAEFKGLVADVFPALIASIELVVKGWLWFRASIDIVVDSVHLLIAEYSALVTANKALGLMAISPVQGFQLMGAALDKSRAAFSAWKADVKTDVEAAQSAIAGTMARIRKELAEGAKGGEEEADTGRSAALRAAELEAMAAHQKAILEVEKAGVESRNVAQGLEGTYRIAALQRIAAEEIRVQEDLISKLIAIAREDPNHPENVVKLQSQLAILRLKLTADSIKSLTEIAEARIKYADLEIKEAQKTQDEVDKILRKEATEALKEQTKKADDADKARDTELSADESHIKSVAALQRQRVDAEFAAGKITEAQHAAMLTRIEDQEYESIQRILRQKIEAIGGEATSDLAALARLHAAQQAAQDAHNLALEKINGRHLEKTAKAWQDLMKLEQRDFTNTIDAILRGQESLVAGSARMVQRMLADWVTFLAKKLIHYIAHTAVIQSVEAALKAILVGMHLASASEEEGVDTAKDLSTITGQAGVAGATAYAFWAWDPILAAAAAAEAFAATMAFAPAATAKAQRGGIFSEETFTLLHPKEMVLPAAESQMIQGMAAGGGSGGSSVFHLHMNFVDASQARRFWDDSKDHIIGTVKEGMRQGRLG